MKLQVEVSETPNRRHNVTDEDLPALCTIRYVGGVFLVKKIAGKSHPYLFIALTQTGAGSYPLFAAGEWSTLDELELLLPTTKVTLANK